MTEAGGQWHTTEQQTDLLLKQRPALDMAANAARFEIRGSFELGVRFLRTTPKSPVPEKIAPELTYEIDL